MVESFDGFPDWFVVMLTVATYKTLLTLQTDPQQLQLVVLNILQTLQPLQLLAGVDGDDPLGVTVSVVQPSDHTPPPSQPSLVQSASSQTHPFSLHL